MGSMVVSRIHLSLLRDLRFSLMRRAFWVQSVEQLTDVAFGAANSVSHTPQTLSSAWVGMSALGFLLGLYAGVRFDIPWQAREQ